MTVHPLAEPFLSVGDAASPRGRIGVLLSHGFTGSPASMKGWGEYLAAQGYAVSVPRLPGHGTTWQEMNTTTWADWNAEVERAFEALSNQVDSVFVCGLSMGGGLALRLAADHPDRVAGLVLVNPAVGSARKDVKLLPVLKHVIASFPGIANDIKKP
ncbi:MAG: alpha/beta fold hydrolase, partial [Marmoricola sp.]